MRRALLVAAALLVLGVAAWALLRGRGHRDGPPNFVVIDIDTLSVDRLGQPGPNGASTTPRIDAFAAQSARFSRAFSSSGWTLPALVSILGGRWPAAVEVERGEVPVAPERDLPKILGLYGYHTAGAWGDTLAGAIGAVISQSFAERLPANADVPAWIASAPEPFFLYVHEVDLHAPAAHGGHRDWRSIYAEGERQGGEEGGRRAVMDQYQAHLAEYDGAFGRVLDALDDAGLDERTVVILTSDHGQDFFTHAFVDHGVLYDSTLHVPLIVHDPAGPRGVVLDRMVQTLDLAPTVLSRAGIPLDTAMQGQPLQPLLGGAGAYDDRPVYSLSERCHVSLRTADTKVILRDGRPRPDRTWVEAGGQNGARVSLAEFAAAHPVGDLPSCGSATNAPTPADLIVELYDLAADPEERTSLIAEQPERAVPLVAELLRRMAAGGERAGQPLTDAQKQAIQQQGYWGMMNPDERK